MALESQSWWYGSMDCGTGTAHRQYLAEVFVVRLRLSTGSAAAQPIKPKDRAGPKCYKGLRGLMTPKRSLVPKAPLRSTILLPTERTVAELVAEFQIP
jgi:hypothetical protein